MAADDEWCVYMVRCADRTLYTGVAKDVEARVIQHNSRKGAKYTRTRTPVELVYRETCVDQGSALRREYEIKQLTAAEKNELLRDFVA